MNNKVKVGLMSSLTLVSAVACLGYSLFKYLELRIKKELDEAIGAGTKLHAKRTDKSQ